MERCQDGLAHVGLLFDTIDMMEKLVTLKGKRNKDRSQH